MSRLDEIVAKIKPYVLGWIRDAQAGQLGAHDLAGSLHTGTIADSQAPQFVKTDGSRQITGNQGVADGVTVDGVDISVLGSAYTTHASLSATAAHGSVGVHNHQDNPAGGLLDHGLALSGLGDDDHPQYASAEGSGTRRAYEAGRLNKSITAGAGLTGGGLLTADRTLDISAGVGITVSADAVAVDTTWSPTWTGDHTFQGQSTMRHVLPELTDSYDLGSAIKLWRQGYLSQLNAVLFAEQTAQLLGGWFIVPRDAGKLPDVAAAQTQIDFGKGMTIGHFIVIRSHDASGSIKTEYMQIGSLVGGTTYNVTRDIAGVHSPDPAWADGTSYAVLGTTGDGRIELNAYDTPRLSMIRQGATYNAQAELIRLGDLNGNWGYNAETWGLAFGEYAASKPNITIDPTNGMRFRTYTSTVMQFDVSGNADITGKLRLPGAGSALAIGATPPTAANAGTGGWIDRTGIYGLNANALQAKWDFSNGKITAAGGILLLDVDGVSINLSTSYSNSTGYKLLSSTDAVSIFQGFRSGNVFRSQIFHSIQGSNGQAYLDIFAEGQNTAQIDINVRDPSSGQNAEIALLPNKHIYIRGYIQESIAIFCRVRRTTVQAIPSNAWTGIIFSESVTSQVPSGYTAMWTGTNPTRLYCREAGVYTIVGHGGFDASTSGDRRYMAIRLNATTFLAQLTWPQNAVAFPMSISTIWYLSAGDYVELVIYQNTGANLNILLDAGHYNHANFEMARIA